MKYLATTALAAAAAFAFVAPAGAVINAPVPTANYIVFAGQDWAWASPCAAYAPSCGGDALTAYQASQGWRIPTAAEFAAHPQYADFAAAGLPCASAYFGSGYSHCDFGDGQSGYWFGFGYTPGDFKSTHPASETLLVRGGGAVPEPATWALMIGGFGLAGAALRRRRLALAA